MKIIKITPRGYCHGVVKALNLVSNTINDESIKKPIYILGEIVHNNALTQAYQKHGIITLDMPKSRLDLLDTIPSGTVIVTAHGASPKVFDKLKSKNLDYIDATCPDVYVTHDLIKEKLLNNYEVLYIGKKNHPEPEGAIGINPDKIHLISNKEDIDNLSLSSSKLCITNQTTMSMWDVKDLMDYSKTKFPSIEKIDEICTATSQRQEATFNMAREADLTLVVGDPKSNNTNKLVEVSEKLSKCTAYRINNIEEIDIDWLLDPSVECVAVTSGASTPTRITKEIISFIEQFEKSDKSTWINKSHINSDDIIPRPKKR